MAATSPSPDPDGGVPNIEVDYVINYTVPLSPPAETREAEAAFITLIESLTATGLATEVRPGRTPSSLLVFVKLDSQKLLKDQVYRYRVQDWLYGVRIAAPNPHNSPLVEYFSSEPVTEAERLRLAYLLITKPKNEGGAGITPKVGAWRFVQSVFPLHDRKFNREWIKEWSTKYVLDESDLTKIRDKFGERVAFYFAFLQSYFQFLVFPAAFGLAAWLILGGFSWFYAAVNCLWSVVFFEHWKMKEADLAVQWGVKGVSKIQLPRSQFKFETESVDPVTGEIVKVYSPFKRLARQLLVVPFAAACVTVLGGLIVSCFAIEIFINEVYAGPFKAYLTFLPTILLTIFNPTFTTLLTRLAQMLTELENYQTVDDHQASFVRKIFVINFITSYLGIFLTAFVYVPFGKLLVPYLDVFAVTAQKFTTEGKPLPTQAWEINPDRLKKQVIYFTVTAQVVNFATEVIVPYAKRKVFKTVEKVQSELTEKNSGSSPKVQDTPEEAKFLKRVRDEAELDQYDVTIDYREMVIQFGYLSLFSVVWPLTACSFLVNNWVEARSDAMKIAANSQRPIPWRADSIGPWLDSLGFLSWLGSVTSAALVFLFKRNKNGLDGSPWDITGWALLMSILCSEHLYLVVQRVVRGVIKKMDSPGLQKERAERFAMRKQLFERMVQQEVMGDEKEYSKMESSESSLFWGRQGESGAAETIQIGRALINQAVKGAENSNYKNQTQVAKQ